MIISIILSAVVFMTDMCYRKIHNITIMLMFLSGCMYAAWTGGIAAVVQSLAVLVVVLAIGVLFWKSGGLRGGDVKYVASLTMWMEYTQLLYTVLLGCIFGVMAAIAYLYATGRLHFFILEKASQMSSGFMGMLKVSEFSVRLPFGACLALGAILVIVWDLFYAVG